MNTEVNELTKDLWASNLTVYSVAGIGLHLEPEAQQLVSALEEFISGMLVRLQVVQHSSRAENKLGIIYSF
jgi:hypothetical protein